MPPQLKQELFCSWQMAAATAPHPLQTGRKMWEWGGLRQEERERGQQRCPANKPRGTRLTDPAVAMELVAGTERVMAGAAGKGTGAAGGGVASACLRSQ
jgi:hypothetical protein